MLLGSLLASEDCAERVAGFGLLPVLVDLLKQKQEDDEIVLQIVYVFQRLVRWTATRSAILQEDQAVAYLVDLVHDKNSAIRGVCEK